VNPSKGTNESIRVILTTVSVLGCWINGKFGNRCLRLEFTTKSVNGRKAPSCQAHFPTSSKSDPHSSNNTSVDKPKSNQTFKYRKASGAPSNAITLKNAKTPWATRNGRKKLVIHTRDGQGPSLKRRHDKDGDYLPVFPDR
jgi:hypothetical protein